MGGNGGRTRVLFVTTEYAPFSKVGGLGDVAGSLPQALYRVGIDVHVVTTAVANFSRPLYSEVQDLCPLVF